MTSLIRRSVAVLALIFVPESTERPLASFRMARERTT
jgi:hypothetical protein